LPVGLTLLLALARLTAAPALTDPVAGSAPASLYLATPPLYLVFAPLFTLWDGASMLSLSRLRGLLLGLALLYLAWRVVRAVTRHGRKLSWMREVPTLATAAGLLVIFLLAGAVWHRPMLSLAGVPPDEIVVDFHSHTRVSHDVENTLMRGYDTEANRRWHARAGFDAVFITDHNIASRQSGVGSHQSHTTVLCPGIEVSAWRAHIVLLGDSLPVDRSRYSSSLAGLLTLLRVSDTTYGALSVASLPEYQRNHWLRLDTLIMAGLDGFEIVNAAPKANEITRSARDSVIRLARAHNRFVVGVSDSHGWGATSMVWNLVRIPNSSPSDTCGGALRRLQDGFAAASVIERHRLRPDDWWPFWLTPVGVVWESWRSMGWELTAAWLVWIWLPALGAALISRRRSGPGL
jgi:hypothetical protein